MGQLRRWGLMVIVFTVISLAQMTPAKGPPPSHQMRVNGVDISYVDQGAGTPVVFTHGSFSDLRFWEPQREAFAQNYRFIAYTYRYHGTARWPDTGKNYSVATHTADLTAFIRGLKAGPVHLVAISSGGRLAAFVASENPELLRSLTLAEPAFGALLADMPEAKPHWDDRRKAMAKVRAAVKAGDAVKGTKLFFESVNNRGAGAFDKQPEPLRQMILDNARTVPLSLSAPRKPQVSCATLNAIKTPTLITRGEHTLRFFSLISEITARCVPGSRLVTISNATHPMSIQNPTAFNEAVLQFVAQH